MTIGESWGRGAHPNADCGGCGARWRSPRIHHCSACHESFSSITYFDAHRFAGRCDADRAVSKLELRRVDGVWCGPKRPEGTWSA